MSWKAVSRWRADGKQKSANVVKDDIVCIIVPYEHDICGPDGW